MNPSAHKRLPACLWTALSLCCALLLPAGRAAAQPTPIYSAPTTLTGTAVRMISYREQEHSWQTSDGNLHLMINQGTVSTDDSLVLYSSFDKGNSYQRMASFPGTDQFSTSDGQLTGNTLQLVYAGAAAEGSILFSVVAYDPASKTWTVNRTETAFKSTATTGINPALRTDDLGVYWVGFTAQDVATGNNYIKMISRAPGTPGWKDTGLTFGAVDNASIERSARPVALPCGVGMIFTVHQTMYWAYRLNNWPATQPWVVAPLYAYNVPNNDPYASHFSVASDGQGNLYLSLVDGGQLIFMRYLTSAAAWGSPRVLSNDIKATYPQVTIAGGSTVVLMVNDSTQVRVWQSPDFGKTFTATHQLVHPPAPAGGSVDYSNPRVESPGKSQFPIATWQQYVDGPAQKLMYFQVPAVGASAPAKP